MLKRLQRRRVMACKRSNKLKAARHGKGIRSGYVLYYRYDLAHDIVYVLRILHGKRDITRALFRVRGHVGRKE